MIVHVVVLAIIDMRLLVHSPSSPTFTFTHAVILLLFITSSPYSSVSVYILFRVLMYIVIGA